MKNRGMLVAALGLAASCTSNQKEFSDVVKVETNQAFKEAAAKADTGLTDYDAKGEKAKVEWFSCVTEGAKTAVLAANLDDAAFGGDVCKGWLAQTFLTDGYNVIAVNRPGFGKSTGKADLGGARSEAALEAAAKAAGAKNSALHASGAWGYGTGATAVAFYGKHHGDAIKWLILGGGIYDAEITHRETTDAALKKAFDALVAEDPDEAYERRSVAWDIEGLPKTVRLYHGDGDRTAPSRQASQFRDALATQEVSASLLVVEGGAHQLSEAKHRSVLQQVLGEIKK